MRLIVLMTSSIRADRDWRANRLALNGTRGALRALARTGDFIGVAEWLSSKAGADVPPTPPGRLPGLGLAGIPAIRRRCFDRR